MQTTGTKDGRRRWLNFAMVSAVVVGLSFGAFQLLPESHPMRALRGVSGATDQVPELGTVRRALLPTETHQALTFNMLTSYPFREPNWAKMEDPAYIASLKLDEQISPQIQAMNGKKVEIQGFMLPLDMSEDGNLRTLYVAQRSDGVLLW